MNIKNSFKITCPHCTKSFSADDFLKNHIEEHEKNTEKRIKELENSLSIALEINDKYQRENKELKIDNSILADDVATLNNRLNEMNPLSSLRKSGL